MILISIPVHEKVEVVMDQIANIRKFAPDSQIVIHPAKQFVKSSNILDAVKDLEAVWVNSNPLYTGFGMVLKCHISNFQFAKKVKIPFTHFCLHSSNDLFVRSGVESYIRKYDFGFFHDDLPDGLDLFSHWKSDFEKDHVYQRIMRSICSPPTQCASQVEGTFYPREAFENFARCYMRYAWREFSFFPGYVHGRILCLVHLLDKIAQTRKRRLLVGKYAYPREEFYPPNFFSTICPSPAPPYCLMNWQTNLTVTTEDIETIRNGRIPTGEYRELFAVKRVNRDINDPLRKMIQALNTTPHTQ